MIEILPFCVHAVAAAVKRPSPPKEVPAKSIAQRLAPKADFNPLHKVQSEPVIAKAKENQSVSASAEFNLHSLIMLKLF